MDYAGGGRIDGSRFWLGRSRVVAVALSVVGIAALPAPPAGAKSDTATALTLFSSARPATAADRDRASTVLGVKFRSSEAGHVTGIRFFKSAANKGRHTGALWTSSGRRLATLRFSRESASGWQTASFAAPVAIAANRTYVASYHAPKGRYAADESYFSRPRVRAPLTAIGGRYAYGRSMAFPNKSHKGSNYYVDVVFRPASASEPLLPAPFPDPLPDSLPEPPELPIPPLPPLPLPTPTPEPGSCPTAIPNTPDGPDPWGGCFPGPRTTGVPDGVTLTNYTGPCTITQANTVIDSKTVNCQMEIRAASVTIRNSLINGHVWIDSPGPNYSFTITDSTVDAGPVDAQHNDGNKAIGKSHFTAIRVETIRGISGIWCEYDCTVRDSWVHGQDKDEGGHAHQSGIRMGSGAATAPQRIIHTTIACDAPNVAPDAGCSAGLTGYGDFATIQNNFIERNLFIATPGGTCAYGGSSGKGAKPYPNGANNVFRDNIFQRGSGGKCGYWYAIVDLDAGQRGNQWINNRWDNGGVMPGNG